MKFDVDGDVVHSDGDVDYIVCSDCNRYVNVGVVVGVHVNVTFVVGFCLY